MSPVFPILARPAPTQWAMIANAPDNELIRRHPPYWRREEDSSKFERMFRILERDLDQMALAMNKDPLPEECGRIAEGLEKMARDVAFDFGL
ncbi:hypothetical protein N7475_002094 [Penicillium sp. IBT 31633x]|nr:hypothetical protein N7475_002094 [Penicillium sp. IBT 31633x]